MKINFQTKGVIVTAKQKRMIEKKLMRMKKYINHSEPAIIDITLGDETGAEKGGIDQSIKINVTFGKEQIFIEEIDNRIMRAFAYALDRLERNLKRWHEKQVENRENVGVGRWEKVFGILKRRKNKKSGK